LEIGTEEIPARFIPPALEKMKQDGIRMLQEEGFAFDEARVYGTPRRLVFSVQGLSDHQAERSWEVLGPPKKVAFDAQGAPTPAALGFAKNQGVGVEALRVKTTEKGEYLSVEKREAGRVTSGVLPDLLPRLLSQIVFPKAMRWNDSRVRFARPIRWILALYGDETVAFTFAGVNTGRLTSGHPFLSPGPHEVSDAGDYWRVCDTHFVTVDPEKRRDAIRTLIDKAASAVGGAVAEDVSLLEEVTFLVECPFAVCGGFDPGFLELPREVLMTSMRGHQKYFSVEQGGKLLPYFIGVSNLPTDPRGLIRKGYERVLRARLSDARFFYEADRKETLEGRSEGLRRVVFLEGVGTIWDKVQRLRSLTARICAEMGWDDAVSAAARAASLCKSDLLTAMVGEFPELQGAMGREYASLEGENADTAEAIFEHYLPRFSGDRLPASKAGAALALAEKVDNLVCCFHADLIPSGSNDPYALRRQALGILHILIAWQHPVSLKALLLGGIEVQGARVPPADHGPLLTRILLFIQERAEGLWMGEGYAYDTVRAVIASGLDDPCTEKRKIAALDRMRREPEFDALILLYRRVVNILLRSGEEPSGNGAVVDSLLKEPAERELNRTWTEISGGMTHAVEAGLFDLALKTLVSLKGPIDTFFEKVLVNDPDPDVRENRFRLLSQVRTLFACYGDFSHIVVEGKKTA
jgi:glycyl-tRNA synthetase beta chain